MSKRSLPIPSVLKTQIVKFCVDQSMSTVDFSKRCGLSETVIVGIVNGNHTTYSRYSQKRINVVLHNGSDLTNEPRRKLTNVPKGKLIPVPTWFVGSIRDYLESQPNQSVAGRNIGIDGGVLRRIVEGTQIIMRSSSVEKIITFFGPPSKQPELPLPKPFAQEKKSLSTTIRKHPDPCGCAAKEINQIHDAFNGWSPEQREAFSNFAHAFRNHKGQSELLIVTWKNRVSALEAELQKTQARTAKILRDLKDAEKDAVKWEAQYHTLQEKLKALTGVTKP